MRNIFYLIITFITLMIFCYVVNGSIERHEIAECKTWKIYSKEYKGFYLTDWQKKQCDNYGIIINAPVK